MIFTLVRIFRNQSLTRQSNGANHGHADVHFTEPSGIRETTIKMSGRCSGLVFKKLDSGLSGPVLDPGWGHCVVFLGKTLYSHSASLHPGV